MKHTGSKILLAILVCCFAFSSLADSDDEAFKLFQAGESAYQDGHLNRAKRLLTEATTLNNYDGSLTINKTYRFRRIPIGRNIRVEETLKGDAVQYTPNKLLKKLTEQLQARAERKRLFDKSKKTPLIRITSELLDEDYDGLFQAEEDLTLKITLTNHGDGNAENIRVKLSNEADVSALSSNWRIVNIPPSEQTSHEISFSLARDFNRDELEIKVTTDEQDGYSADSVNISYNVVPWTAPKLQLVASLHQPDLIAGTTTTLEYFLENTGNYPVRKLSVTSELSHPGLTILEQQWPETYQLIQPNSPKQLILRVKASPGFDTRQQTQINFLINDNVYREQPSQYMALAKFEKRVLPGAIRYQFGNKALQMAKRAQPITIKDGFAPLLSDNPTKQPNSYALVIGNRDYTELDLPVPYAINDAKLMQQVFKKVVGIPAEQILQLNNATLAEFGIMFGTEGYPGRLQTLVNNHSQDVGTLYVYYSGHGIPAKNRNWSAYLMPSDGNADYIEHSGYALDKLYKQLALVEADNIVVFLDACFSGQSPQGSLFPNTSPGILKLPVLPNIENDSRISVLSAAGADDMGLWLDQAEQGLFTTYLARGLSGDADDDNKQLSLQELYYYVKQKVGSAADRMSRSQTPTLSNTKTIQLINYGY
jgi:hypothetical protein